MEFLDGEKNVEYRTWKTDYRGDILLAACATPYTHGFVACVANLKDIKYDNTEKIYAWVLDDIRVVKPIKVVGKVRLFDTDIEQYEELDSDEAVDAAYAEATWIEK